MATSLDVTAWDHGYGMYGEVLAKHVRDGRVDYRGLRAQPEKLRHYLAEAGAVTREEFSAWNERQRMAFLINIYNASTLDLVVRHYPVASIRDIGSVFVGPWRRKAVRLWGSTTTLDDVEHEMLRKDYREPRVHFALVCAARSCPPLRMEPYVADRLEAQFEDQGRLFLRDPGKNRLDTATRTLHLSRIFEWFEKDFTVDGGTVIGWVAKYLPADAGRDLTMYRVSYLEYDWSLNDRVDERGGR